MSESKQVALSTELDDRTRRFALEFFGGEHAGNATRSFLAVHPKLKESSAASAASDLLKDAKVQTFLEELHREARTGVVMEMRPWMELAAEAQRVVLLTCRGKLRSRLCLDSAALILDRCLGKPTERREIELRDENRVAKALYALSRRKQAEPSP